METESQGSKSDLPKVTLEMTSKIETEIAKSALCPELEELSAASLFGAGEARSAEVCEKMAGWCLMHIQD